MRISMKSFIISMLLVASLMLSVCVLAQDVELIDPDTPESWYEAPKLASELGITKFQESPMLKAKVENGKLPPVEDRLPDNPPVVEPFENVGKYGGTAVVWSSNLNLWGNGRYLNKASAGQPSPDGNKMFPRMIKGWEFSDNSKNFTIHLREGLKWSDGQPFTADDYMFWWEHEANDKDLNPIPPQEWNPVPLLNVTKEDDFTVTFHFASPYPRVTEFNFQHSMIPTGGVPGPLHYMKQVHPDFVGKDAVTKMAKDVDLDRWDDYFGRIKNESTAHPEYKFVRPVLTPYICIERTETYAIYERNPYFPFVDTAGNQLPYIDQIRVNLANSPEMAVMKATTGEATLAARYTKASQIPLYKRNEQQGNYRTLLYHQVTGSDASIKINMTHKDLVIREIFQDLRFRKALSYAMDREEINQKIYFGFAVIQQTGVHPTSDYYNPEIAKMYTEHDQEKARSLLEEIGMVDVDNDGYRERPDGKKFNPTLLYCQGDRTEYTPILELFVKYCREVGLNVDLKMVSRSLHDNRCTANNFDLSVWMDDGVVGVKYGNAYQLGMHTAPMPGGYAALSSWPAWINWYSTKGEEGMEPPEEIKQLVEWGKKLGYSTNPQERYEAGVKLTEAHTKNLWTIGTVAMGIRPFMISNKLKNVPETGLWAWGLEEIDHVYPMQFYLEE